MESNVFTIVVGVDGSPAGVRALRWAVREAAGRGGRVRAVTAFSFAGVERSSIRYRRDQRDRVARLVAWQVEAVLAGYPRVGVRTEVTVGATGDVLVAAAGGADLLVLGGHDDDRSIQPAAGSIAEQCARRSTCPVVVIPPDQPSTRTTAPAPTARTGLPVGLY